MKHDIFNDFLCTKSIFLFQSWLFYILSNHSFGMMGIFESWLVYILDHVFVNAWHIFTGSELQFLSNEWWHFLRLAFLHQVLKTFLPIHFHPICVYNDLLTFACYFFSGKTILHTRFLMFERWHKILVTKAWKSYQVWSVNIVWLKKHFYQFLFSLYV